MKLQSVLKLDAFLSLGYSITMMFAPLFLTTHYFHGEVDEHTLHLTRSWGTTLFAMTLGTLMSLNKDQKVQQFGGIN
mgnify:CR=1 FL=1